VEGGEKRLKNKEGLAAEEVAAERLLMKMDLRLREIR
jgi:hypothetical protein